MTLPDTLLDLLRRPSPCFLSTVMTDGSPQVTETWVGTDGEHVIVNTVVGFVEVRNVERDPRVALAVQDPEAPSRCAAR
jgi:predicted pyridoxine 5'-phosphate oxidase superfamily flavin-nucleotide-binding protein